MNNQVILVETDSVYPEYPYPDHGSIRCTLEALFAAWGLEPRNPFGKWLKPGGCVLLKPNWVRDYNPLGHNLDSLITHSSLIHHLIDFVAIALKGEGRVVIADAPLQNCHFPSLIEGSHLNEIVASARERYPGLEIILEDWRLTVLGRRNWRTSWVPGRLQTSRTQEQDNTLQKYLLVDLGKKSFLEDISDYSALFRVTNYKCSLMQEHHRPGKHEYLVTRRIAEADLAINLPKMKTHIKAGLTGALKNLVGINGHKEFLPHHIKGPYFKGGDNYCLENRFREYYEDIYDDYWEKCNDIKLLHRKLLSLRLKGFWLLSRLWGREKVSAGSWSGNETIWRTTLDLNHIMYFNECSPRKVITIVDGIIAGEGDGPLSPEPKPTGVLIGGENPAYIDATIAKLMGYNISRIPTVYNAIYHRKSQFGGPALEDMAIDWIDKEGVRERRSFACLPNWGFRKPRYWRRAATRADS